jgi:hypothetical protein
MENSPACCPEMPDGKKCDYLDFVYRLTHYATVNDDNRTQRLPVEVAVHVRLERCTGPLELGNLVYSTTLLPGEKVRLFSQDRRSRFTYDSESQLSYRHEQMAEEQYYMNSVDQFMSDLESSDSGSSSSTSSGSASSSAGTSGLFGSIINGPSVNISGSYNAQSTHNFLRELNVHAASSHNRAVQMTRESSSISIGEVSTRQHVEGESESHLESSSRQFANPNRCHAVSYLFYQVNKVQTIRLTLQAIRTRVIDPIGNSAVVNRPIPRDSLLTAIPAGVLANSNKLPEVVGNYRATELQSTNLSSFQRINLASLNVINVNQEPISQTLSDKATTAVHADLQKHNILDAKGNISKEIRAELEFEFRTSLPTPGVVVKGCLDDCQTCEPALEESIKIELENKRLQNELLKRRIDLLEKSQEYRCCPVGETEEETPCPA